MVNDKCKRFESVAYPPKRRTLSSKDGAGVAAKNKEVLPQGIVGNNGDTGISKPSPINQGLEETNKSSLTTETSKPSSATEKQKVYVKKIVIDRGGGDVVVRRADETYQYAASRCGLEADALQRLYYRQMRKNLIKRAADEAQKRAAKVAEREQKLAAKAAKKSEKKRLKEEKLEKESEKKRPKEPSMTAEEISIKLLEKVVHSSPVQLKLKEIWDLICDEFNVASGTLPLTVPQLKALWQKHHAGKSFFGGTTHSPKKGFFGTKNPTHSETSAEKRGRSLVRIPWSFRRHRDNQRTETTVCDKSLRTEVGQNKPDEAPKQGSSGGTLSLRSVKKLLRLDPVGKADDVRAEQEHVKSAEVGKDGSTAQTNLENFISNAEKDPLPCQPPIKDNQQTNDEWVAQAGNFDQDLPVDFIERMKMLNVIQWSAELLYKEQKRRLFELQSSRASQASHNSNKAQETSPPCDPWKAQPQQATAGRPGFDKVPESNVHSGGDGQGRTEQKKTAYFCTNCKSFTYGPPSSGQYPKLQNEESDKTCTSTQDHLNTAEVTSDPFATFNDENWANQ